MFPFLAPASDPRDALDAVGRLPDIEIDIADAALQLARIDAPDADWRAARAELSGIARRAVALRGDKTADLFARTEGLAGLLSGYRGDVATYDDPANANLIHVIERRKGLPVALGILWLHACHAAGWEAHGVDFPSHFLVALDGPPAAVMIDVFDGGTPLDARHLRALIERVAGDQAEPRSELLKPMSTREVLLRLQNNLKTRRLAAGDLGRAVIGVEDMLRIAPDHAGLWHEAGLIRQHMGQPRAALHCFQRFLDLAPEADTAAQVWATMHELRQRLN